MKNAVAQAVKANCRQSLTKEDDITACEANAGSQYQMMTSINGTKLSPAMICMDNKYLCPVQSNTAFVCGSSVNMCITPVLPTEILEATMGLCAREAYEAATKCCSTSTLVFFEGATEKQKQLDRTTFLGM